MLLTLPWLLSVYGGKVDFVNGSPTEAYAKKKSDRDTDGGLFTSGIQFQDGAKANAKLMMLTSFAYFCIQIPALMVDDQKTKPEYASEKKYMDAVVSESSGVHTAALVGAIVCVALLALYLFLQVQAARTAANEAKEESQADVGGNVPYLQFLAPAPVARPPADGWLLERGIRMHIQYLRDKSKAKYEGNTGNTPYVAFLANSVQNKSMGLSSEISKELKGLHKSKANKSKNKEIRQDDMYEVLVNIGLNYKKDEFNKMFAKADANNSKTLEEGEFIEFFREFIIFSAEPLPWEKEEEKGDGGDDDDEMPDEFKDLAPDQQRKAILTESFQQMIIGTVLVLIFSDPMVDCLGAIGKMSGVPAFYVAFLLAPLASNASELVASFKLASKKSPESITQSLQTLEGAAIMNNTYCLGIFYGLIYVQGLAWKFTAETLSIVLVQLLVGAMVFVTDKQTVFYGVIVFSFYPLSLIFVAVLEANGID